jgi:hypothetical protein
MANIDIDFQIARRQPPHAAIAIQRAPAPPGPRQPKLRPKYSRINAGQFIRTILLLALCMGAAQLPRAEKALSEKSAVTALMTP